MRNVGAIRFKAQLVAGDAPAMGPGKADLLRAIDATGSISAGARQMGMSYRRAWQMVQEMNGHFAERLVETAIGGSDNGARLTATGRLVLTAFTQLEDSLAKAVEGEAARALQSALKPSS